MKNTNALIFPILLLIEAMAYGQSNSDLYAYDKEMDRASDVVQRQQIDSLTILEKVVLDGHSSKIPFYLYSNQRNPNPPYIILLHGLGDQKEDWIYPSEPYLD